jgi:cysteine desulfuration protein SufE
MEKPFISCLAKQSALAARFAPLADAQKRYELLIEMGRALNQKAKREIALPQHLVHGCQSEVYVRANLMDGKVFFDTFCEALISSGLLALLLAIFEGESPETILTCPPSCLENLGIQASLSPGRSNGLASIYLKMKQEALQLLVKK